MLVRVTDQIFLHAISLAKTNLCDLPESVRRMFRTTASTNLRMVPQLVVVVHANTHRRRQEASEILSTRSLQSFRKRDHQYRCPMIELLLELAKREVFTEM